jgi:hypothetical protein
MSAYETGALPLPQWVKQQRESVGPAGSWNMDGALDVEHRCAPIMAVDGEGG